MFAGHKVDRDNRKKLIRKRYPELNSYLPKFHECQKWNHFSSLFLSIYRDNVFTGRSTTSMPAQVHVLMFS